MFATLAMLLLTAQDPAPTRPVAADEAWFTPEQATACAAAAERGKTVFAEQCVACHGDDAKGKLDMGSPNLTDKIWLYGGTPGAIETTIRDGRHGQMPAWSPRLSDPDIHVLAGYVYHLSHHGQAAAQ